MSLWWWWFVPLLPLALAAFAYFAPRKDGKIPARRGGEAIAPVVPGMPFRVSVSAAVLSQAGIVAAPQLEPEVEPQPEPFDTELPEPMVRDAGERLRELQSGIRDAAMLHDLLADPAPAIRSAALDIALEWHDLDAVSAAMADPVIPIAARAALAYTERTSQAACDAELNALSPAHAEAVRARLADLF